MHHQCLKELQKYGLIPNYCALIRSKDGVHLYRIRCKDKPMVIKIFDTPEIATEIQHYETLFNLDIQTPLLIDATDRSFIMEDFDAHPRYRLANAKDLYEKSVVSALAHWYKSLHQNSMSLDTTQHYNENKLITEEALNLVLRKTKTADAPAWEAIFEALPALQKCIENQSQVLTYNDFFWTNLVVSHDLSEAFMFDYNLLGAGFVYSDIRNVTCTLPEETKSTFLKTYGTLSTTEKRIDAVTADLVNLIISSKKQIWPSWADESVNALYDGSIINALQALKPFYK